VKNILYIVFLCFFHKAVFAQQDTLTTEKTILKNKELLDRATDPLAPSRAAFYSAIVPGLGQIYNRSYWKLPLVYGGMGTSMYFYFHNQKQYQLLRDDYKRRLKLGSAYDRENERFGQLDDDRIIRAQRQFQKSRDLCLVITLGIYILNIVDANVDAHLQQFNVDDDLSFEPSFQFNEVNQSYQFGMTMRYKF